MSHREARCQMRRAHPGRRAGLFLYAALALAMLIGVNIPSRPAWAGWGFRAWMGDPNEAHRPGQPPGDPDDGPDIKLPPGYGDSSSAANAPTLPTISNTAGDALPPMMNFSSSAGAGSFGKSQ